MRASYLDFLSGLVGCCRSMSISLAAKLAASQSLGNELPRTRLDASRQDQKRLRHLSLNQFLPRRVRTSSGRATMGAWTPPRPVPGGTAWKSG